MEHVEIQYGGGQLGSQCWHYGGEKQCQTFWKYWFMESLSAARSTGILEEKTTGLKGVMEDEMQIQKVWDSFGTKLPKSWDYPVRTPEFPTASAKLSCGTLLWC